MPTHPVINVSFYDYVCLMLYIRIFITIGEATLPNKALHITIDPLLQLCRIEWHAKGNNRNIDARMDTVLDRSGEVVLVIKQSALDETWLGIPV
jgi:hypothetical protein